MAKFRVCFVYLSSGCKPFFLIKYYLVSLPNSININNKVFLRGKNDKASGNAFIEEPRFIKFSKNFE